MSLFAAPLIPGLILVALGVPLLIDHSGITAAIKAFPRSASAGYVVFSAAAAWFLYNIWNLSKADFGEYRTLLFIGFAAIAVLAFKCVPDFLGVRGACALVLIGAAPFLDAAYMEYEPPAAPLHGRVRLRGPRARDLARGPAVEAARLPRLALREARALPRPRRLPCGLRLPALRGRRSRSDDARSPPERTSAKDPVLLVLAGPAGSGKSTLCDRLVDGGTWASPGS
jgi:hypothetical protein